MRGTEKNTLAPQSEKSSYFEPDYLTSERMSAYSYQFSEVINLRPQSVLEIGIGNGLLSFLLRQSGLDVTTLDFDSMLEPDIIASVTDIPCPDNSYDVVACFEVLEHLPFEQFGKAMEELKRVTKSHAIISLPDSRLVCKFHIPIIARKLLFEFPSFTLPEHKFDGQHYWEINKKGYPLRKILGIIQEAGFSITKTYRIWEFSYNRIFVLEKIDTR